jgi:hypothetical protein
MRLSFLTPLAVALVLAAPAAAAGPWLGAATNGLGYQVAYVNGITHIGEVTMRGEWGLPVVTLAGTVGGLSSDRHTLVLAQMDVPHPDGALAKKSVFKVLSTKLLRVRATVTLRGDYGYDALSPHGRTLYLIQRVSSKNLQKYRVRAYDLVQHRLLARVIADKTQRNWLMDGYPVARATSPGGRWIYTLYANSDNYPFVHALDTVKRTAVCVGIPLNWTTAESTIDNSTLRVSGNKLFVSAGFVIDRTTFQVTKGV